MARATEYMRMVRSQLHRWGFAPMTSDEEDAMIQSVREDGNSPDRAAAAVAWQRVDRFTSSQRA
jgi:hypothetical protein